MNDVDIIETVNAENDDPPQKTHPTPKNNRSLIISERTVSRLVAVQALYAMEISGKRPSEVIQDLEDLQVVAFENLRTKKKNIKFPKNFDQEYTISIIRGVVREQRVVDPLISDTLPDKWTFNRIEKVLTAILRASIYELLFSPDIPPKVTINEYTNIASSFDLNTNNALVNGILNAISRENNLIE